MKNRIIKGVAISNGIGVGTPFLLTNQEDIIPEFLISPRSIDQEICRFQNALMSSQQDLKYIQRNLIEEGSPEIVAILDTHLEMLQDPSISKDIEEEIRQTCKNAEVIFMDVIQDYKEKFQNINDGFFQEKIRDITDISKRVLSHLRPFKKNIIEKIPAHSILICEELIPSMIAEVDPKKIKGIISKSGGISSHASIIARAKGIPYVAHIDFDEIDFSKVESLIVDGSDGKIHINPSKEVLFSFQNQKEEAESFHRFLESQVHLDPETIDGYPVRILENLEDVKDVENFEKNGASGIGLFRSEYLFLATGQIPTEEEQFEIYRKILEKTSNYSVVIRVFDIGGDKSADVEERHLSKELNPVLGCRAIRFLLRYEKVFESQLRALLRASVFGDLYILVPMISDLSEIKAVRSLIKKIQKELKEKNIPFEENIPIGCMIEVPSSAIMCDILAKESDFLSIGTNDLIQYVVAADRSNPHISNIYTPAHPSILRLIRVIVSAANHHKKRLILCGEVAGDPLYLPLLLGSGIKEFSVSARLIPIIKNMIRKVSIVEASYMAEEALECSSSDELYAFIKKKNQELMI